MLKGAIFDFDGTLFDSMSVWNDISERYLIQKGYVPAKDISGTVKAMSLYQACCYMKTEYGIRESAGEIGNEINRMIENSYRNSILPKEGVKGFLQQLKDKGVHMCIATATDRYLIEAALHRCEMSGYFEDILTCADFSTSKDEPLIFREALRGLGTHKCETMIFEDAYHAIQTAKEDGFLVTGIFDRYENRREDVKKMSDVYLSGYSDTEKFWKFVSEL